MTLRRRSTTDLPLGVYAPTVAEASDMFLIQGTKFIQRYRASRAAQANESNPFLNLPAEVHEIIFDYAFQVNEFRGVSQLLHPEHRGEVTRVSKTYMERARRSWDKPLTHILLRQRDMSLLPRKKKTAYSRVTNLIFDYDGVSLRMRQCLHRLFARLFALFPAVKNVEIRGLHLRDLKLGYTVERVNVAKGLGRSWNPCWWRVLVEKGGNLEEITMVGDVDEKFRANIVLVSRLVQERLLEVRSSHAQSAVRSVER